MVYMLSTKHTNVTVKQLHNVTEKNKKLKAHIAVLEEELKNLKKS